MSFKWNLLPIFQGRAGIWNHSRSVRVTRPAPIPNLWKKKLLNLSRHIFFCFLQEWSLAWFSWVGQDLIYTWRENIDLHHASDFSQAFYITNTFKLRRDFAEELWYDFCGLGESSKYSQILPPPSSFIGSLSKFFSVVQ